VFRLWTGQLRYGRSISYRSKNFSLLQAPRPVPVPIQLLGDWILGTLSLSAKRQGLNLSSHLNSVPKLSMSRGLCIHSLLRVCGVWR